MNLCLTEINTFLISSRLKPLRIFNAKCSFPLPIFIVFLWENKIYHLRTSLYIRIEYNSYLDKNSLSGEDRLFAFYTEIPAYLSFS